MSESVKKPSLSEQLKIQQMYSQNIKNTKTDVQIVQDELAKTQLKLRQVTKKPIIVNN